MWDDAGAMWRITKGLLFVLALLLIGTSIAWVYHSDHFPVERVSIHGKLTYIDSKQLQDISQQYMRGNIFRADLNGARDELQKMPWVDSALVRRRLPDEVEVILTERVPLARWENGGLVDTKGNVFNASVKQNLPLFEGQPGTGKDMADHYHEFNQILKPVRLSIKKLIYTKRSAWLAVLNNGITVRLGRENEIKRLQQFAKVWPSLLSKHQGRLEYADMRYKDGFAVRYRETAAVPSETGSTRTKTLAK